MRSQVTPVVVYRSIARTGIPARHADLKCLEAETAELLKFSKYAAPDNL